MRKITNYPAGIKASVLEKALAPNAPSVVTLSAECNIPISTIKGWIASARAVTGDPSVSPQDKNPLDKLLDVLHTLNMSTEEQSAYCRTHGIYQHHLDTWKQEALKALGAYSAEKPTKENKKERQEIKALKRDLARKDKALAEASALLILKKKAALLWGEPEEDV